MRRRHLVVLSREKKLKIQSNGKWFLSDFFHSFVLFVHTTSHWLNGEMNQWSIRIIKMSIEKTVQLIQDTQHNAHGGSWISKLNKIFFLLKIKRREERDGWRRTTAGERLRLNEVSQGRMYNSDDDDDIQGTTPFAFLPSLPFSQPTRRWSAPLPTYVRTCTRRGGVKKGEKEVEEEEGLLNNKKRRGLSFLHFLVGKGNRRRYCERKTFLFFLLHP
jgi:hypothetical protein